MWPKKWICESSIAATASRNLPTRDEELIGCSRRRAQRGEGRPARLLINGAQRHPALPCTACGGRRPNSLTQSHIERRHRARADVTQINGKMLVKCSHAGIRVQRPGSVLHTQINRFTSFHIINSFICVQFLIGRPPSQRHNQSSASSVHSHAAMCVYLIVYPQLNKHLGRP